MTLNVGQAKCFAGVVTFSGAFVIIIIISVAVVDDVKLWRFVQDLTANESLTSIGVQTRGHEIFGRVIVLKAFFRCPIVEHIMRAITTFSAAILFPYVSADQITVLALAVALFTFPFLKSKNVFLHWIGFALVVLREFIDCLDGDVARANRAWKEDLPFLTSSSSSSSSSSSFSAASWASSHGYAYFFDGLCDSVIIYIFLYICHLKWRTKMRIGGGNDSLDGGSVVGSFGGGGGEGKDANAFYSQPDDFEEDDRSSPSPMRDSPLLLKDGKAAKESCQVSMNEEHFSPPVELPPVRNSSSSHAWRRFGLDGVGNFFANQRCHLWIIVEYICGFLVQSYCYNGAISLYSNLFEQLTGVEAMAADSGGGGGGGGGGGRGEAESLRKTLVFATTPAMVLQSKIFFFISHSWMLFDPSNIFIGAAFCLCIDKEFQFCRFGSRRLAVFAAFTYIISLIHVYVAI